MQESKSCALPLGDSPIALSGKGGYRDSNPGPPEPQSGALTNCAIPTIYYYLHTPGLLSRHYGPTRHNHDTCPVCERVNEPGGIRTLDLRLRRPLLYPAELQTHFNIPFSKGSPYFYGKAGDGNRTHVSSLEGWCSTIELHPQDYRGDRIRTCDLLVPNQAL